MLAPLLFALVSPAMVPAPAMQAEGVPQAVRVWLNRDGAVNRGDKVRVYTRAAVDGYLLVTHVEPTGRVRVLFPLDPLDDNFVRAGQDYELRGRGDREAIRIYDESGAGTVYAALSPDPLRFDGLVLNGHWDYRAAEWTMTGDPEADLTALVAGLADGARFDYDVQRYVVGATVAYGGGGDWYQPTFYDPYVYGHSWFGGGGFSIGIGYGHHWRSSWWDPWYWDPWDPWWYPVCWGGCYGYGWPSYYGHFPSHRFRHRYVYTPTRYVYVTSPVGGRYTFKSGDDRYGLAPNPVGPRRRSVTTASAGSASSPARTGVAPTRRATGASSPAAGSGTTTRATPGRRTTDQAAPSGTRAPTPQAAPTRRSSPPAATPPARPQPTTRGTPTRRQQSQPDAAAGPSRGGERLADGSWRLSTPPRRTLGDPSDGGNDSDRATPLSPPDRRSDLAVPTDEPRGAARAVPPTRGLRVANDAPEPRSAGRPSTAGRTSQRAAAPSRVEPSRPSSPSRSPASASSTRRTASSGERSGARPSAGPSRAAPSRTPAARPSPARTRQPAAAPSRTPARSSPPRATGKAPTRRK